MKNVLLSLNLTQIRSILTEIKVNMSRSVNSSLVPTGVRGMKVLDRDKFTREINVPILKVTKEKILNIVSICKPYLLKLENFKPVYSPTPESSTKTIYLDPQKITKWLDISENERQLLEKQGVDDSQFGIEKLELNYNNFGYDAIFKAILPENEETVSGFSQIGHITHLNLKNHLLDYRNLIGQVLVDKIKPCRTVVNKNNTIDNTYRNFDMEVIAGDKDFLVTVKEYGCYFQLDFSKVYWNPRLGKEHERVIKMLKPGDVLFDVFCGVGPFSIPAAKLGCKVFANDLNPEAYKWLNLNTKGNKIRLENFQSYCMDGKDFIQNIFKNFLIDYCKGSIKLQKGAKIYITMNLPEIAVTFLKYFKGLLDTNELKDRFDCEIIVFLYCFAIGEDPSTVAKKMVDENLEMDMSTNILNVVYVRNVAPKKEMMKVTFKLTKEIIFHENKAKEVEEPPSKKTCTREIEN